MTRFRVHHEQVSIVKQGLSQERVAMCLSFFLIEIQEFGTVFERNQKLIQ